MALYQGFNQSHKVLFHFLIQESDYFSFHSHLRQIVRTLPYEVKWVLLALVDLILNQKDELNREFIPHNYTRFLSSSSRYFS